MKINEIYQHYQIMPNLQLHLLRVAGVAEQICESLNDGFQLTPEEKNNVIFASLLHDMGNIIKFDLTRFPQFCEPAGSAFWLDVQNKYLAKYGKDEHEAALQIARELKISSRIINLIDSVGFHQINDIVEKSDISPKICEYADARVSPFGIVSLDERLQDLKERYHKKYPSPEDVKRRKHFKELAHQLEDQVFAHSAIKPQDITDATVNTRLQNLQKFEIITI